MRSKRRCHKPRRGRAIVITESVFSMDGDLTPLREVCEIAERAGAVVIVDEAHATGMYGDARIGARRRAWAARSRRRHDAHRREGAGIWRRVGGGVARAARCDGESCALVHFFDRAAAGPGRGARCGLHLVEREPERRREVHRKSSLVESGASQNAACRPAASR